jgi:hypothetical protein
MRKVALFATVVCFIFCYSLNAVGQNVESSHYIGATTGSTLGGRAGGLAGMNALCRAQYAGTSHMCNTDEFFSTALGGGIGAQLWVQPALHNCLYDATPDVLAVTCQEAGSLTVVPETNLFQTCGAWTLTSGLAGTSVKYQPATGWVLYPESDCSESYRVACCNP